MAPKTTSETMHPADEVYVDQYFEKIKQGNTPGSVLDLKTLSEATGTQVIVLQENKQGELQKMHVLEPTFTSAINTIYLVYRPASKDNPEGHYNVCIDNTIYKVRSEGNNCMYHAFAQTLEPDAHDSQLSQKAIHFIELEANMF